MVAVVEKLKKFGKNIAWSISIFLAYNAVSFVSGYFIFKFVETQYNRFVKPPYTDESNQKLILILFIINLTPVPFWIDYIFSSPKKD